MDRDGTLLKRLCDNLLCFILKSDTTPKQQYIEECQDWGYVRAFSNYLPVMRYLKFTGFGVQLVPLDSPGEEHASSEPVVLDAKQETTSQKPVLRETRWLS